LLAASSYALYNARWQVKLFFKWIMQFFGPSGNAAKSNIGITVSVYVLVAIVKKHLSPDASFDTVLQIFSVTLFKKMCWQRAQSRTEQRLLPTESIRVLTGPY
jgi:hypothetical protein